MLNLKPIISLTKAHGVVCMYIYICATTVIHANVCASFKTEGSLFSVSPTFSILCDRDHIPLPNSVNNTGNVYR